MNRHHYLASLMLCALALPALAQHHGATGGHEWDYAGSKGPASWGALKSDFSTCKVGLQQSPIDIRATTKGQLAPIAFDYARTPLRIIDNGHTVQVNMAPGSGMSIDGVRYELLQFHFHTPSEERIHGKFYPLVAHLVHKSAEGKLAVVALLFKLGKENPLLATVFGALPAKKGVEDVHEAMTIDLASALPHTQGYYNFAGSLTTPPCSEEVNWFVLKTPVEMSPSQLKQFHRLYKHNARPVQPLHDRVVKESD
jgi:carbonic anhydrase